MIEIRSCALDDPTSLALDNEVWPDESVTAEDMEWVASWFREYETWLALEDSEPVGTGFAGIPPHRDEVGARIGVPPRCRRRGAGTALWRTASGWAAGRGYEELHAWVPAGDPDGLDWARRRGYVEVGREDLRVLDLATADLPLVVTPNGIELTSLGERPDLERAVYAVTADAWRDIPGHATDTIEPYEKWRLPFANRRRFPPAGTVLALADGEVVGYTQLQVRKENTAWHAMTGVKREWRGRGIAAALKLAQLRWAKEAGIERVTTMNETRNAPIVRLNERLGYRLAPGRIRVRGPIAGS
jgi:GNAT superfamily N-acetyltransferase